MGAVAQLSHATVEVEPGRSATFAITVRNTGTVVDRFTFEALGAMAAWVTFAPPTLSLFPEASGTVNIIVAPPRDPTVTAGAVPLGVRVSSAEDAAGTFVEETTVNVAPFSDITVELVPRVARGRIMGRTQMAVDNRSNCAYRAELSGTDPQAQLAFAFRPPIVDVSPGAAAFVKVGLRPRSRFWKGPEKTIPFRLTLTNEPIAIPVRGQTPAAETDTAAPSSARTHRPPAGGCRRAPERLSRAPDAPATGPPGPPGTAVAARRPPSPHREEITTDGSMLHGPLLPRWLLALAAALIALAVLLLILWYALFRPQIRSTAQNEVNKQLTANGITPVSSSRGSKSGGSTGSSSGGSGQTGSGNSSGSSGAAVPGRGLRRSGPAGPSTRPSRPPETAPFWSSRCPTADRSQMTDLLVENSAGERGEPGSGSQRHARDGVGHGQLPGPRLPLDHPDRLRARNPGADDRVGMHRAL